VAIQEESSLYGSFCYNKTMIIDLIAGIILSLGVAHVFELPVTPSWIFFGILFALLPDVDFFTEFLQRGTVGGKKLGSHRVLTHIPLLFVPPAVWLYLTIGTPVAVLFIVCILWHFTHDSHAMGYGYRLFYPFSEKFYKFFSDKEGNYRYDFSHFVTSWTKEEVEALHEKYGNDQWIQDHLRHHATKWQPRVILLLRYSFVILLLLFLIRLLLSL
jgi:hypothetical protein